MGTGGAATAGTATAVSAADAAREMGMTMRVSQLFIEVLRRSFGVNSPRKTGQVPDCKDLEFMYGFYPLSRVIVTHIEELGVTRVAIPKW
ncbi:hypothetical protein NtRootA9_11080 [Arthrobacter sp. NtRootA9]|nr:hypothetical protein NtRootA9_11080 [Arthrobacter sp. NtRootA9]